MINVKVKVRFRIESDMGVYIMGYYIFIDSEIEFGCYSLGFTRN
jgi:hypothetical protein